MRRFTIAIILLPMVLAVATAATGAGWDDQFGLLGPQAEFNGSIQSLWVEGSDLYVVGLFTMVDGMPAGNIARWDGAGWSTLGNPTFSVSGIYDITRFQGDIVVAGEFTSINGQPGDVAVWNGVSWAPLGNSPLYDSGNDDILSLQVIDSLLYIGGRFSERIVSWDGVTTTSIVDTSTASCCVSPRVYDLAEWNGDLIAAGIFNTFNNVSLKHVGRWDGVQWNALGVGLPIITTEVFVHNGDLYVLTRTDVYRWTGSQWVSATGVPAGCASYDNAIFDATFFEGDLYRTGGNEVFGTGQPLYGVSRWTNSAWDDMRGGLGAGAGCDGDSGPLVEYDGNLLVGGDFSSAGGIATSNLAAWSGDSWYTNSPSDRVRAILTSGTDVYVGGDFTAAEGIPANRVARWDGAAWSALGAGIDGVVHDMVVIGGDLYVGGEFTDAGGSGAQNLARWNGAVWSQVGAGFGGGPVYDLATDGEDLYVGGNFLTYILSQAVLLRRVARWDGASWDGLGGGIPAGVVKALATDGSNLYVGGEFVYAGAVITGNAARWDGAAWTTLGLGFDDTVRTMEIHGGALCAGGDFVKAAASSDIVGHVARWDGNAWLQVGGGPPFGTDGPVRALASSGYDLIVAGEFTTAGAVSAHHIARWDGAQWEALAGGLNKPADAVAASGGEVWVGGQFETADGKGSPYIAHWTPTPTAAGGTPPPLESTLLEPPYPNPFNPQTTIRYVAIDAARIQLAIYDVNGRRIRTLVDVPSAGAGPQTVVWDGRSDDGRPVASGVYYVRLQVGEQAYSRKLVLLK